MDVKEIPAFVRNVVEQAVEDFNRDEISGSGKTYHVRFQGCYVYVDRDDGIGPCPVFRLEYTGDLSDWGFAIYKYSADDYDDDQMIGIVREETVPAEHEESVKRAADECAPGAIVLEN